MELQIKTIVAEIISDLKEKYKDLNLLLNYNGSFNEYELVIENGKYEENEEFEELLQALLEEKIYSKGLYVYAYFTDDFDEIKKDSEIEKTIYKHEEVNFGTHLNSLSQIIKTMHKEKPALTLSYDVPISSQKTVTIETRTLASNDKSQIQYEGEIKDGKSDYKSTIIIDKVYTSR